MLDSVGKPGLSRTGAAPWSRRIPSAQFPTSISSHTPASTATCHGHIAGALSPLQPIPPLFPCGSQNHTLLLLLLRPLLPTLLVPSLLSGVVPRASLVHCGTAQLPALSRSLGTLCPLLHCGVTTAAPTAPAGVVPSPTATVRTLPCKRAYKRAVQRAQASPYQGTYYRGQWCSLHTLNQQYTSSPGVPRSHLPKSSPPGASYDRSVARLRVASYNIGGLSQDAYAELMHFLAEQDADTRPHIVLLQETHWKDPSEYTTDLWHVVSTPSQPAASGGVAILVSSSLCQATALLHASPVAGRILQLRLTLAPDCTIDIINVYEKVWMTGNTRSATPDTGNAKQQRREVWNSLRQLLGSLPAGISGWWQGTLTPTFGLVVDMLVHERVLTHTSHIPTPKK